MKFEQEINKIIPRVKEEINLAKKVNSNTIKIKKHTSVTNHVESLLLRNEEVEIEEVLINKEVAEFPETRETQNLIIIPVVKEIEVVVKKKILVKEIHIRKIVTNIIKDVDYVIREEHIDIEGDKKENN